MIVHACDLCGVVLDKENRPKKFGTAQYIRLVSRKGTQEELELCNGCSDKIMEMFAEMRKENGVGI